MLANANPQLNEAPVDRNVREVIAVCAKNGIAYGELNSLVGFMRALKDNKQFAMNFWSLVARLSEQPADPANPEWLLGTIVEGVTGMPLAKVRDAGPAHRVLVTRLSKMIAGEDIQNPVDDVPAAPAPQLVPDSAVLADPTAEPAPEALPLRSKRVRKSAVPPIEPITNPAWTRDESLRLVLHPEPVITEVPEPLITEVPGPRGRRLNRDHDRPIAIPLSGYTEESPRGFLSGGMIAACLVLLLLGVGGFALYRTGRADALSRVGSAIHAGYDSAVATWRGEPSQTAPAPPQNPAVPAATSQATPAASSPASAPTPVSPAAAPAPQSTATAQTGAQPAGANSSVPQPAADSVEQRTRPRRVTSYPPRLRPGDSMAAIAASHQHRHAEPPAAVIPIPDVTSASPAPRRTGSSQPVEQPSAPAPTSRSGGATGVSNPPSAMQQ